jgi:hypothetical protein
MTLCYAGAANSTHSIAHNTTQEVHMATKKVAAKSTKKIPTVKEMVRGLEDSGLKVQVVGSIRNGQLQIEQASLQELQKKFPNAKMTFVAVNAPFDPVREISN